MSDIAVQAWTVPRAGWHHSALALACALGAACAFAVAGAAVKHRGPEVPVVTAPVAVAVTPAAIAAPPGPPPWLGIIKPVQIFSLEAPQFRQQTLAYSARRPVSGEAREDTLAYGIPSGEAPMLRLALLRGTAPETPPGLDDGLTRLADRQGFVPTLGARRGALTTRFGRFETATLRIPGRVAACDGFHLALPSPALAIDGIACGTAQADLACLIDRLDLASAGEDFALVGLFAAAELRRNPACSGMRLGPDVVHAAWLDDKRATPAKKMRHSTGF